MRQIWFGFCFMIVFALEAMEESPGEVSTFRLTQMNAVSVVTSEKSTYDTARSNDIINKTPLNSIMVDYSRLRAIDGVMADKFEELPLEDYESIDLDEIFAIDGNADGLITSLLDALGGGHIATVGNKIKEYIVPMVWEYTVLNMVIPYRQLFAKTKVTYDRKTGETNISVDKISEEEKGERQRLLEKLPRNTQIKLHLAARKFYISDSCKSLSADIREYIQVMKLDESHNPLCHISECIEPSCVLSRTYFPQVRAFFEDQVMKSVKNPAVYLDHCCGNLYQTMVILETLRHKEQLPQTVILIDQVYKPVIDELHAQGTNVFAIEKRLRDFDYVQNRLKFQDKPRMYGMYYALRQFVQWYKDMCTIVMYPTAQEYVQDCKANNIKRADLITSVDYFAPVSEKDENNYCEHKDFTLLENDGLADGGVAAQLIKQGPMNNGDFERVELRLKVPKERRTYVLDPRTNKWGDEEVINNECVTS